MNRLVRLLPILLFSAVAVSAQTSSPNRPPNPQPEESSVSGMVVRLAGDEPPKSASVQLQSLENRAQTASTVTDAGGRFEIKGIDPGRHRLSVSRNGFVPQEYGQRKPDDPGAILSLRPREDLKDLLFRLIPSAVIAGRVSNEDEGRRYHAFQKLEVGNADVDGANLTIAQGTSLSGHVRWEGAKSLDADFLTVFLRGAERSYGFSQPGYRQLARLL